MIQTATGSNSLRDIALNQIEIYFSIVQRKALTPNDFSLEAVASG